ncbi:MAG TPA: hypothetical protein VFW87_02760 [Pirellulales bacterium]|nr:hypothetical protein [Pirellulales bacterium]
MIKRSPVSPFAERVHDTFEQAQCVVALVDELLALCRQQGLRFDWRNGTCRVRAEASPSGEQFEVALAESAFRAVLARIAALCNERSPQSVSPYGGQGELAVGGASYQVAFSSSGPYYAEEKWRCVILRDRL